ncbi:hypothetical protein NDU88_007104 [Pleurodeles waltl]|uniref:Uncharacterized protein n=1 Tax=Pleurodeles waltl TaxID=8319 RepID=A0AAV7UNX9_PLEWA|nr:hypothetical protein NDU88_007104 [Pleurodeles waltl]
MRFGGRRGVQGYGEHAQPVSRVRQAKKQAQPPLESGVELREGFLEESSLGGAPKMAASSGIISSVEDILEEGQLGEAGKIAAPMDFIEDDVILIIDEEIEVQGRNRVVRGEGNVKFAGNSRQPVNSVFDEHPSTSRGASARFECLEEELLDYDEEVEEQVMPAMKGDVKETPHIVPKVVRGDHFGNRCRDMVVGSLPRGEEARSVSVGFGGGREDFGVGMRVNVGGVSQVPRKDGVYVSIQVGSDSGAGADKLEVSSGTVSDVVPKADEAVEVQDTTKSVAVAGSGEVELFRQDGIHLSFMGNENYLLELRLVIADLLSEKLWDR